MSKLYMLLDSVITKLKAVEKVIPKKVSDLEQDVTVSYNDLTDVPALVTDEHINSLIDAKLGVIENGTY